MIMRSSESLNEAEWKKLCVKGMGTIKRLKRRDRDVIRHRGILEKVCLGEEERQADPLIARLSERQPAAAAAGSSSGNSPQPVAVSRLAGGGQQELPSPQPAASARGKFPLPAPSPAEEPRAPGEQPSLRPRIVLCQRSSDGSFSTISPAAYSPVPRKRPADTPSVSTEIKAIQQTRRLLANARERTRVHTISAAFEALRKQVPCYSYGQKLSKLAILRIACNYILSLARLADLDYSSDHSNMSFSECVEQCTKTLQAEGRSKKRKE
ncbi:transcription factor atoh8 [Mustelus asterias]